MAVQAGPAQYDAFAWQVVPLVHGAAPSTSHSWAHIPPMMQTNPEAHGAASTAPHVWGLVVEHASPPEKRATASSRLMGGTLSKPAARMKCAGSPGDAAVPYVPFKSHPDAANFARRLV